MGTMHMHDIRHDVCVVNMSDESTTLLTASPSCALQENEENDTRNEETINQEARTLENYLKFSGFGVFHVFLLLVSGLATAADAVEIFGVSFVVPIAEDDLNLSTGDKGWLDASIFIGISVTLDMSTCNGLIYLGFHPATKF